MDRPDAQDVERVARALRAAPVGWLEAKRGEEGAPGRWIVTLEDGRRAFAKIGWTSERASWLRDEHRFYEQTTGEPFVPRLLGWDDDGERPALALEDLSDRYWPPPWHTGDVDAVLSCLSRVAATAPPPGLPPAAESQFGWDGWPEIERDPEPFLAIRLCSSAWLDDALPTLRRAAAGARIEGDALLHFDVRSDNLCLAPDGVILVDWNAACLGNALLDVASWLPSLEAEGGPAPEDVIGHPEGIGELAALLAGYFGAKAGLPPIGHAPHVRPLQLMQARTALPWAARELSLPPPA